MEFVCLFLRCHFAGKPLVASPHVSCFVRLLILMHVILRGVFVNEKYYYHSFGHCDAFCRPKWRILAGYNMLLTTASLKWRLGSHCNVCTEVVLHHLSKKSCCLFQSSNHGWKCKKNNNQFVNSHSSARGRKSTKAREASDVNSTCSSSIACNKVHVSFVASSQTHLDQPIMPSC